MDGIRARDDRRAVETNLWAVARGAHGITIGDAVRPVEIRLRGTSARGVTGVDYEVVFEIATSGPGELTFVLPGLLGLGIGLVAYRYRESLPRVAFLSGKAFATAMLGFSAPWTVTAAGGILAEQSSARADYAAGNFEIAEGLVEDFEPRLRGSKRKESFTVDGKRFEYADFFVTPGFNDTVAQGGPIRSGLVVRISHRGNLILKLEVAKGARAEGA